MFEDPSFCRGMAMLLEHVAQMNLERNERPGLLGCPKGGSQAGRSHGKLWNMDDVSLLRFGGK